MTALPFEAIPSASMQLPMQSVGSDTAQLRLVESQTTHDESTQAFEDYFTARLQLHDEARLSNETVAAVQQKVNSWLAGGLLRRDTTMLTAEQYGSVDMDGAEAKIAGLVAYLREHNPEIPALELEVTELFLGSTRHMYEAVPKDGSVHPDADGSFAFIVPARMSRNNTEYGGEVESVIPALKYVPHELRSSMLIGLPPFVIDRYVSDARGTRGYLVFAPVYPDSQEDLSRRDLLTISRQQVDATVDFAYGRLGATFIGLGAVLPSLTNYGKTISNKNVITTTGHGGTAQLVLETMRRAEFEERITSGEQYSRSIGILGLGAIGASIARIVRLEEPSAHINVYDIRQQQTIHIAAEIGATALGNIREVLEASDITIAALPSITIDVVEEGIAPRALAGKLIIDDSQPAVFSPKQIADQGATLAWVVGHDGNTIVRSDYNYGNTLVAANDLFGCEAEVAVLSAYYNELIKEGTEPQAARDLVKSYAISASLQPEMVWGIKELFERYGITAAPLQAFGVRI